MKKIIILMILCSNAFAQSIDQTTKDAITEILKKPVPSGSSLRKDKLVDYIEDKVNQTQAKAILDEIKKPTTFGRYFYDRLSTSTVDKVIVPLLNKKVALSPSTKPKVEVVLELGDIIFIPIQIDRLKMKLKSPLKDKTKEADLLKKLIIKDGLAISPNLKFDASKEEYEMKLPILLSSGSDIDYSLYKSILKPDAAKVIYDKMVEYERTH